jgi:hypothetical protein
VIERDRILARADELERLLPTRRDGWFLPATTPDTDFPGGAATRTAVVNGACVFLQRDRRGCTLHALALASDQDYHDIKPMVSTLFPVTFGDGALFCSEELLDGTLVCGGTGPTAYDMARAELAFYFGAELVGELDRHAADTADVAPG